MAARPAPGNDDDAAVSPDDNTAKQRCIRILREMEFRCINNSAMNYELSSKYDTLAFSMSVASSIATGLATLPVAKLFPSAGALASKLTGLARLGLTSLLAGTTASVSYTQAAETLLPNLRKKMNNYNKAGAAWQRLELDIRVFLATSTKQTTSVAEYRDFIEKCGNKREEICVIARPDQSAYQKYHGSTDFALERYRKSGLLHEEFRRKQKEIQESLNQESNSK